MSKNAGHVPEFCLSRSVIQPLTWASELQRKPVLLERSQTEDRPLAQCGSRPFSKTFSQSIRSMSSILTHPDRKHFATSRGEQESRVSTWKAGSLLIDKAREIARWHFATRKVSTKSASKGMLSQPGAFSNGQRGMWPGMSSPRTNPPRHADDVVILTESAADLQRALHAAHAWACARRFHFSIGATQSAVMVLEGGHATSNQFRVRECILPSVSSCQLPLCTSGCRGLAMSTSFCDVVGAKLLRAGLGLTP